MPVVILCTCSTVLFNGRLEELGERLDELIGHKCPNCGRSLPAILTDQNSVDVLPFYPTGMSVFDNKNKRYGHSPPPTEEPLVDITCKVGDKFKLVRKNCEGGLKRAKK